MVNHIFMYSFVSAFFSVAKLIVYFFFYLYTAYTLHVKANLRRVQNVICWEEKKGNFILLIIFCYSFSVLIFFISFSRVIHLVSYFLSFLPIFSNIVHTRCSLKSNSSISLFLSIRSIFFNQ